MAFRFVHAADIHLGYAQYHCDQRYLDFAHAFEFLIEDVIERKADFLLLAGDLFHHRTLDAETLLRTTRALELLKEQAIPLFAVAGNHERVHPTEGLSWLEYLTAQGFMKLLSIEYSGDGQLLVTPWKDGYGTYVDLPCGVRIVGVHYVGAATPRVVRDLAQALPRLPGPRPAYTILMLHAGLQGILDNHSATLARTELDPLRPMIDYLALGHIHKPFVQDDWIYNPGSLETNSTTEVEWEDRGYFWVEVDVARSPTHRATKVRNPRRYFERLVFRVDPYQAPDQLYAALQAYLRQEATPERAQRRSVVELHITGVLSFDSADLDTRIVEQMVKDAFAPIVCQIKNTTAPTAFEVVVDGRNREEIEREVVREILERDVRRRAASRRWTDLVLALKQMALDGDTPEQIVATLREFRETAQGEESAC